MKKNVKNNQDITIVVRTSDEAEAILLSLSAESPRLSPKTPIDLPVWSQSANSRQETEFNSRLGM